MWWGLLEMLHLILKLGMCNGQRTASATLLQIGRVEPRGVVVGGALGKVRDQRVSGPLLDAKHTPAAKGSAAAWHPRKVVELEAATESVPACWASRYARSHYA